MKQLVIFIVLGGLLGCVPIKKYKDLEAKYAQCQEEQASYKSRAIDFENQLKELNVQTEVMRKGFETLQADTARLGDEYRQLAVDLYKTKELNKVLEDKYAKLLKSGSASNASLLQDLEATRIELQAKEDRLNKLEKELNTRERALSQKEARIKELESMLRNKDEASKLLKEKIASALRGFTDKGISVEERDGKIYVSMEAQLLFPSGSTAVNPQGKKAIIDLAAVLEAQEDIDILVEGHTDSDALRSAVHPKDNWELSVLRATSVVKIMLGNSEMNPLHISASGRSEYQPVDPHDKAKNRRIEIIITPDLSELFELISNDE
ncbi:OmpA family protein [Crocinitomix algicola]|uniref:OmpA family protein n=1 Tax=Crocinitomix algicola TaxID=1740263 RepID=UPI00082D7B8D|nr:OmpA family protein [Crocinitomix algicola]